MVRAQGVIFMHVSHNVACGSHFHPGVEIHAPPPPHPGAMGVDDGLFTLHHGVISDTFFCAAHGDSLSRLDGKLSIGANKNPVHLSLLWDNDGSVLCIGGVQRMYRNRLSERTPNTISL